MIERLPCKPPPTSWRPLIEMLTVCMLLSLALYLLGV